MQGNNRPITCHILATHADLPADIDQISQQHTYRGGKAVFLHPRKHALDPPGAWLTQSPACRTIFLRMRYAHSKSLQTWSLMTQAAAQAQSKALWWSSWLSCASSLCSQHSQTPTRQLRASQDKVAPQCMVYAGLACACACSVVGGSFTTYTHPFAWLCMASSGTDVLCMHSLAYMDGTQTAAVPAAPHLYHALLRMSNFALQHAYAPLPIPATATRAPS